MVVSITQLRKDLFELVNQALEGREVLVTYKGRRFRIAPEKAAPSRLSRLTEVKVINERSAPDGEDLRAEMVRAWERDWAEL